MKRPPLVAIRRRVVWAALYGLIAPPLLFTAGLLVRDSLAKPSGVPWPEAMKNTALSLVVLIGIHAALFGLLAAPVWFVLHRRQAHWPQATVCGAVLGLAVPLISLLLIQSSVTPTEILATLTYAWLLIVSGGAIGVVTSLGIWLIAYRRAPPASAVAETFA